MKQIPVPQGSRKVNRRHDTCSRFVYDRRDNDYIVTLLGNTIYNPGESKYLGRVYRKSNCRWVAIDANNNCTAGFRTRNGAAIWLHCGGTVPVLNQ